MTLEAVVSRMVSMRMAIMLMAAVLQKPPTLTAQHASDESLKPSNGKLTEGFSELTSVRELADGRVLLTDRIDNRVVVADFRTGRVMRIGRIGDGPREYRHAFPLFAIGGDSSVMTGFPKARWTLFRADSVVGTTAPMDPTVLATSFPYGMDRSGHVLTLADPPPRRLPSGQPVYDSTFLVLLTRGSSRADTIGTLDVGEWKAPLFRVYDQPLLCPDGWTAIVHGSPYKVSWRAPDGRWTAGPVLDTPLRMDSRERQAYLDRRSDAAKARGPVTAWPEAVPPVSVGWPPMPTMDGQVLIRRTPTAQFPGPRYDVVDHRGSLTHRISVPSDSRILGFGPHSVYLVTADADGIETLTRHPWP